MTLSPRIESIHFSLRDNITHFRLSQCQSASAIETTYDVVMGAKSISLLNSFVCLGFLHCVCLVTRVVTSCVCFLTTWKSFYPAEKYVQLQTPILYRLPWVPGWLPLFPYLDGASHQSMSVFSTQVQVPTSRATRTSIRPVRRPTPSPAVPISRQTKLKSQAQGRIRRKRWDFLTPFSPVANFFHPVNYPTRPPLFFFFFGHF